MTKSEKIRAAFDHIPQSIKNTAKSYKEGRDLLIHILTWNSGYTELEVFRWLRDNGIPVKDLEKYKI